MESGTLPLVIRKETPANGDSAGFAPSDGAAELRDQIRLQLAESKQLYIDFQEAGPMKVPVFAALVEGVILARSRGLPVRIENPSDALRQESQRLGLDDLFSFRSGERPSFFPEIASPDAAFFPSLPEEGWDRERVSRGVRQGLPLVLSANLTNTAIVRDVATLLAREMGFTELAVGDIELSVGEAAVNAIKHGCRKREDCRLQARYYQGEGALVVQIEDNGPGFDDQLVKQPRVDNLQENGLGIFLMRSLMDFVAYLPGEGTTVQMIKARQASGG